MPSFSAIAVRIFTGSGSLICLLAGWPSGLKGPIDVVPRSPVVLRASVVLLVGLALASIHLGDAHQPAKVPRIGFVSVSGDPNTPGRLFEAFRQGLQDLGYVILRGKISWLSIGKAGPGSGLRG
jgi:hypothetical protein